MTTTMTKTATPGRVIPERLLNEVPEPFSSEETSLSETVAYLRLFFPMGPYTSYVLEYGRERGTLFTLTTMDGNYWELGYTCLEEIESLCVRGLRIELDRDFRPTRLGEIEELAAWLDGTEDEEETEL